MTYRRLTPFLFVMLAWTMAVALAGMLNMPRGLLPYVLRRSPGFALQIGVIWGLVPASILLAIVAVVARRPLEAFLKRLGGREPPADREAWGAWTGLVTVLFMTFGQAWQTAALVLLWRRDQLPGVAATLLGPHWGALPDPNHMIPRLWIAAGGVLVIWVGNGLPKLLTPFRGGHEPYDWGKMMRACGWAMTLGGLAAAGCSLLIPDVRTALLVAGALVVTSVGAPLLIWAIYRLSAGHGGLAPPEER